MIPCYMIVVDAVGSHSKRNQILQIWGVQVSRQIIRPHPIQM